MLLPITYRITRDQESTTWDGFMKGRSCLSPLIFFSDSVTCLMDMEKAVFGVCLNFSKDLDITSHSTLLQKLAVCGLDGCTFY